VTGIVHDSTEWILKDRRGLFKGHSVFGDIGNCLSWVPSEHQASGEERAKPKPEEPGTLTLKAACFYP
jgi:hypothetical protein